MANSTISNAVAAYANAAKALSGAAQEDGLACVVCGQRYGAFVPVGRSRTGSQVFACVECVDAED